MVTLQLTDRQAKDLEAILCDTQDEGPRGEGWASAELVGLRELVSAAIKGTDHPFHPGPWIMTYSNLPIQVCSTCNGLPDSSIHQQITG